MELIKQTILGWTLDACLSRANEYDYAQQRNQGDSGLASRRVAVTSGINEGRGRGIQDSADKRVRGE